jgi:glycosyltransferase involved in cell wall biosynthesis
MTQRVVEIVTTAHWEGDPRLNRHVRYLRDAGHAATLTSFGSSSRIAAMWRGSIAIARSEADVVIIPDPEMFFLGSLIARVTGVSPVIDIHEDYGKAAMARAWVPPWTRWFVKAVATLAVWCGRLVSWRVLVAAPELARQNDHVALNLPDPESLPPGENHGSRRLVYVGDLTEARGATAMVQMLAALDNSFHLLLIGGADPDTVDSILGSAKDLGVADRLEMTGRLTHGEAWRLARGALAGLNLLEPVPAYRLAVATKLWEYMAIGLPPIVSDLAGQGQLISRIDPELVCSTPEQAATAAKLLASDPGRRAAIVEQGRRLLEDAWEESRPDLAVQRVVEP